MVMLARSPRAAPEIEERPAGGLLMPALASILAVGCLALGYVTHLLWPRWPEPAAALDAPSLPIVISGTLFNVPPGAIRVPVQRRPGTQERVDLVFLWPALKPPDPATRPTLETLSAGGDRIFVTVSSSSDLLPVTQRLKIIYPRYIEAWPITGADGLTLFAFRADSPYRGEDLAIDRSAPEHFLARCSRDGNGPTRAVCLAERRVGEADITLRFPRAWIANWRDVANGIDRLIAQLHPAGG
jgi:hypothetical protein